MCINCSHCFVCRTLYCKFGAPELSQVDACYEASSLGAGICMRSSSLYDVLPNHSGKQKCLKAVLNNRNCKRGKKLPILSWWTHSRLSGFKWDLLCSCGAPYFYSWTPLENQYMIYSTALSLFSSYGTMMEPLHSPPGKNKLFWLRSLLELLVPLVGASHDSKSSSTRAVCLRLPHEQERFPNNFPLRDNVADNTHALTVKSSQNARTRALCLPYEFLLKTDWWASRPVSAALSGSRAGQHAPCAVRVRWWQEAETAPGDEKRSGSLGGNKKGIWTYLEQKRSNSTVPPPPIVALDQHRHGVL